MPKRQTTEDHLAALRQLRDSPDKSRALPLLAELLTRPTLHGIVIKSAATLAQKFDLPELAPQLQLAAQSLMAADAAKRDPGCEAKTAIIKAFIEWESRLPDFYRAAALFHQSEPVFGGSIDTAAEFRGLAAIGLARTQPDNALDLLVDLLADDEKTTRVNAALALGLWPGPEAQPLLRLKARLGDDSPEVLGEVFASLLRINPRTNLPLVASQLAAKNDRIAEAAALSLGQSRIPEALQPLAHAWPDLRRTPIASSLLLAVGLMRNESAITWLLTQIPKSRPSEIAAIIDALAPYRSDEKIKSRLLQALEGMEEPQQIFKEVFGQ